PAPEAVPATPVAPTEPVVAAAAREKEPELSGVAQADAPAPRDEIAELSVKLREARHAANKATVLGTAGGEAIAQTVLGLARRMADHAKIVVVDLAGAAPTVAATSTDTNAPGL